LGRRRRGGQTAKWDPRQLHQNIAHQSPDRPIERAFKPAFQSRGTVSVVINDFLAKTGASEGAEQLLRHLSFLL
jgi:hypothetical protein